MPRNMIFTGKRTKNSNHYKIVPTSESSPSSVSRPFLGEYPGATGIPAGIFRVMTNTRAEREKFCPRVSDTVRSLE